MGGALSSYVRSGAKRIALVLLAAIGVSVALALSDPTVWESPPVMSTPRGNVLYVLSERWVLDGKPQLPLAETNTYPAAVAAAFVPRDAALLNGQTVPRDFPLTVATYSLLRSIEPRLVRYAQPLWGGLFVLALWLLTFEVSGSEVLPWLSVMLGVAATSFWVTASSPMGGDVLTTTLLIGGTWCLVRARRAMVGTGPGLSLWFLAGTLFALAIAGRYPLVLICAPIWYGYWVAAHRSTRHFLASTLGAVPVVLAVAAYNLWLYGNPTATGYGASLSAYSQSSLTSVEASYQLSTLWNQIWLYLLSGEAILLVILGGFGLAAALRRGTGDPLHTLALPAIVGSVATVVFYGGRPTHGAAGFVANASFARYLLPVTVLLVVYAGSFVLSRKHLRGAFVGVLVAASVMGAMTAVFGVGGLREQEQRLQAAFAVRNEVLIAVDLRDVVITRLDDKWLWPERRTVIASSLVGDGAAFVPEGGSIHYLREYVPVAKSLALLVDAMMANGETVFIAGDPHWPAGGYLDELGSALAGDGVCLVSVRDSSVMPLWTAVPETPTNACLSNRQS